jgi:hypothetical protein
MTFAAVPTEATAGSYCEIIRAYEQRFFFPNIMWQPEGATRFYVVSIETDEYTPKR